MCNFSTMRIGTLLGVNLLQWLRGESIPYDFTLK